MERCPNSCFAEVEVNELYVPFRVKHNVIWFQISVDDTLLVKSVDGSNDFSEVESSLTLTEGGLFIKVGADILSRAVVHQQVAVRFRLKAEF